MVQACSSSWYAANAHDYHLTDLLGKVHHLTLALTTNQSLANHYITPQKKTHTHTLPLADRSSGPSMEGWLSPCLHEAHQMLLIVAYASLLKGSGHHLTQNPEALQTTSLVPCSWATHNTWWPHRILSTIRLPYGYVNIESKRQQQTSIYVWRGENAFSISWCNSSLRKTLTRKHDSYSANITLCVNAIYLGCGL